MKIQLPNREKVTLVENISFEEKYSIVEGLLQEWEETLRLNWESDSTRFFLDSLANYLVWHKEEEEKNKEDKDVLSIWKVEKMEGKRKANSLPFSSLSTSQKEMMGLDGERE